MDVLLLLLVLVNVELEVDVEVELLVLVLVLVLLSGRFYTSYKTTHTLNQQRPYCHPSPPLARPCVQLEVYVSTPEYILLRRLI